MNKCQTCKNQKTEICMQCLIVGGEQTYYWYEEKDDPCELCGTQRCYPEFCSILHPELNIK